MNFLALLFTRIKLRKIEKSIESLFLLFQLELCEFRLELSKEN